MRVLKGLTLSLLGFLLFLSLTVFGLVYTLNSTVLSPDFVVSKLNQMDVPSLVEDFISQQVTEQVPQEAGFIADVVDETIAELDPWIREQVTNTVYSSYDYLLGESQSLRLEITLEPVKEKLRENLWEALMESTPPQLADLPKAELEKQFNELYQQFSQDIPSTFSFDQTSLGPEVQSQLEQVKQVLSYAQTVYYGLIGLIAVLVLGIAFLHFQVRGATRNLGTIFTTYGAIEYGGVFAAKYFTGTQLDRIPIPPQIQPWLPQLLADLLAPLEMFSLGCLIGGVALLVVSFLYRPREAAS